MIATPHSDHGSENKKLYGNLIFELSKEGRKGYSLPKNNYGDYEIPASMRRAADAELPECDELTVVHCHSSRTCIHRSLLAQQKVHWP